MAVESPMFACQAGSYSAEQLRRGIYCILARDSNNHVGSVRGGVIGTVNNTDMEVTAGSGMQVVVAPGEAIVPGTSSTTQSGYYCRVSSSTTLAIAASDPTNPRIDRISAVCKDAAYSGSLNEFALAVETGTPTAGATLNNLNGVAAAPTSSLTLGYVLVPANSTKVEAGNVKNERAELEIAQHSVGSNAIKHQSIFGGNLSNELSEEVGCNNTVVKMRAHCFITTEQAHTGSAYSLLATPDEVTVYLPETGLILVYFSALWQESAKSVAKAAICINGNPVETRPPSQNANLSEPPLVPACEISPSEKTNIWVPLSTRPAGLISGKVTAAGALGYSGDVATGMFTFMTAVEGGPAVIEGLPAGSYKVEIRWHAGEATTVTVKNRRLFAEARAF